MKVWVVTRGDITHGTAVQGVALDENSREELMMEAARTLTRLYGGSDLWHASPYEYDRLAWENGSGGYVDAKEYEAS